MKMLGRGESDAIEDRLWAYTAPQHRYGVKCHVPIDLVMEASLEIRRLRALTDGTTSDPSKGQDTPTPLRPRS